MNLLDETAPWGNPSTPVCLAIGVFDGVHRGHAAVIQQTLADARAAGGLAVAVTFDRHPSAIVAPDRNPPMILPLWKRLGAVEALGVPAALVFTFDAEFSRQPADVFVHRLLRGFGKVTSICVGSGFVFGHRRGGNVELLQKIGLEHGFVVHGIPPVEIDGEVVSSTRVREHVAAGDFSRASALLGRPYALAGEVLTGARLGRQLGFPTANLDVGGLVLPPAGVYAALALGAELRQPAAVNIGQRPTVDRQPGRIHVEAHLLHYEGDLYGQRLELQLDHRLRDEARFESRDDLVRQIQRDVAAVDAWGRNKGLLGQVPVL